MSTTTVDTSFIMLSAMSLTTRRSLEPYAAHILPARSWRLRVRLRLAPL